MLNAGRFKERGLRGLAPRPRAAPKADAAEGLRTTTCLTSRQVWRQYRAVALANNYGFVLNTFVTVSWGTVGLAGEAAWRAHQHFTSLMRSRFREWREPGAWIWTRECGPKLGDHSHVLAAVYASSVIDIEEWANGAVEKIAGCKPCRQSRGRKRGVRTVHVKRSSRSQDTIAQWARFRYLHKALAPDEVTYAELDRRHERVLSTEFMGFNRLEESRVHGQRCGVSTSLNDKAVERFLVELDGLRPSWEPLSGFRRPEPLYTDDHLRAGEQRQNLRRLNI